MVNSRQRLLSLCSDVGLASESKSGSRGADLLGPLLPAVAEICPDFDPTVAVERSLLKLFRNLWFYVALFGLAPPVLKSGTANSNPPMSNTAGSTTAVALQAVIGPYLWNPQRCSAVQRISQGTPPLAVSSVKWLEDELELNALHNPGSRRGSGNDTKRGIFLLLLSWALVVLAALVDAWLWTIDTKRGIFASDMRFSGTTAKLRPHLAHGEPEPPPEKDPVQQIQAHKLWIGFFIDRVEVVRHDSLVQLLLLGRMLQGTTKLPWRFSCHPAAVGTFFTVMLLGLKFCSCQYEGSLQKVRRGIQLLEDWIYSLNSLMLRSQANGNREYLIMGSLSRMTSAINLNKDVEAVRLSSHQIFKKNWAKNFFSCSRGIPEKYQQKLTTSEHLLPEKYQQKNSLGILISFSCTNTCGTTRSTPLRPVGPFPGSQKLGTLP